MKVENEKKEFYKLTNQKMLRSICSIEWTVDNKNKSRVRSGRCYQHYCSLLSHYSIFILHLINDKDKIIAIIASS